MKLIIFIISYILGSIPFGFMFAKIFAKKNILEVGWRKTSGSNVFWYAGKTAGILTGLFDVLKGVLSAKIAQFFILNPISQAVVGMLCVAGHNWSFFIKFAGGRGIATFVGVSIVFGPKILLFSLLSSIPFFILLNSSLATIFLLFFSIYFSLLFKNIILLYFSIFSILPIFIKRLSPISEISLKNWGLIKSRLLYDQDKPIPLRIKKWI